MPASPITGSNGVVVEQGKACIGMTKLEAFTMAAMQAIIRNSEIDTWDAVCNKEARCNDIGAAAVSIARATLSELSKQQ